MELSQSPSPPLARSYTNLEKAEKMNTHHSNEYVFQSKASVAFCVVFVHASIVAIVVGSIYLFMEHVYTHIPLDDLR